jgi:hydrogenase expression/formation protein HypE
MGTNHLGKVDRTVFDETIYPNLGADRGDVRIGPTHGVDFGAIDAGGRAVVLATDPLSVVPGLGLERAGRLAVDVVLADVAVSGLAPTHLTVCLTLPAGVPDEEVLATWRGMVDRTRELDVALSATHVGRYPGVTYSWVGGATALALGDPANVVRPDGAQPGDALVVTTGPGAEVTGLFATLFGDRLDLPATDLAAARERLADVATVEDAVTAAAAGSVTAMHDATECGIQGAFVEMARGAGVRFEIDRAAVPVAPGVAPLCAHLGLDPWQVSSSGTLVVAVDPADAAAVVAALTDRGTRAAVVGRVREGAGVTVDGERVDHPEVDPAWAVYAEFAGGEAGGDDDGDGEGDDGAPDEADAGTGPE